MSNQIEDGFRILALGCAASYGVSFTSQCLFKLHDTIHLGVSGLDSPSEILEAQKNLVRFVNRMAQETKKQGRTEIGENIFDEVIKLLCPCPPWIKGPCH